MSYLVLARKWRPRTFEQVVGQRPVVRTLQNALRLERVAHALLFSGVRGVGKTTLARIMAKALNCRAAESRQRPANVTDHRGQSEVSGHGVEQVAAAGTVKRAPAREPARSPLSPVPRDRLPCNQCDSCLAFNAGTAIDLHEIDGASNRGIQEIRELKENIRFMPVSGKYKIVIIDEVHMLTPEAFNALLKTLEEPPAHVYFMFATTELHKIPVTILSRCQRYELTRVPFAELLDFFRRVAGAEGVEIPDSALEMIVREADGSVRDGLSLLDQVFSFGGRQVSDDDVRQMLGLVDRQLFEHLARALLAPDLARCLSLFDQCYRAGLDLRRFAGDLLNYFRNLVVCRSTGRGGGLLDLADRERAALEEIAAAHSPETLLYCFNLLLKGVEEMQYASRPKLVLEMTFVRAAQTGGIAPTTEILGRLEQLLAGLPAPPDAPGSSGSFSSPGSPGSSGSPGSREPGLPAVGSAVGAGIAEPVPDLKQDSPAPPSGDGPPEPPPTVGTGKKEGAQYAADDITDDAADDAADVHPDAVRDNAAGNVSPGAAGKTLPPLTPPAQPAQDPSPPPGSDHDRGKWPTGQTGPSPELSPPPVNGRNPAGAEPAATEGESGEGRDPRLDWDGFVDYVRRHKVWLAPVLEMAGRVREENGALWLRYDDLAECKLLEEPENSRLLAEFTRDYFQRELAVRFRVRDHPAAPAGGAELSREDRRALANDPLVRSVLEIFNGDLAGVRPGRP